MHWTEEALATVTAASGPQVINDSKTPSGRAHVGALRGVLMHDALYRVLKGKGIQVTYRFGCDDYDPVDELPHGMKEHFQQYLGQPLCNTPPPPGSTATDMADHFIKDFWSVFADLGVRCEFYRMRDIYRTGKFNEAIDRILSHAPQVREIYKKVSNSDRPAGWLPFQTICENCGRVGTTECTNYDGKTVEYFCNPSLVEWAKGCGHRGKVSPFDGRGKLPWKLEWVAKWATFPVTIEGAGEDHSTKGGSRDVAAHCVKAIYGREAPLNCPYGFVLVGGAKMSSSKGLGVSAREMTDFLPPEILRFLMIRTPAKRQVNFEPTEEALVKLFNEYDRAHKKTFTDPKFAEHEKTSYFLSEAGEKTEGEFFDCDFGLVIALVQMPHLDIVAEFEKIKGSGLTGVERGHLERRIHAAKEWLARYATPEERLTLQVLPPPGAGKLTAVQRAFVRLLGESLRDPKVAWNAESLQGAVFDAARMTPIDQPSAFAAFYRVVLDNTKGPKAGNLLAFLEREKVVRLLAAVPWAAEDEGEFLRATATTVEEVRKFAQDGKAKAIQASLSTRSAGGVTVVEAKIYTDDSKHHVRRVIAGEGETPEAVTKAMQRVLPFQMA